MGIEQDAFQIGEVSIPLAGFSNDGSGGYEGHNEGGCSVAMPATLIVIGAWFMARRAMNRLRRVVA